MPTIIADISIKSLVHFVVWIIIAAMVYFLFDWAITKIGLGEPFNKMANAANVLLAVLIVIAAILELAGHPIF